MKVLILTSNYPNEGNPIQSVFVHNQVKALKARGIEVAVFEIDTRSIRRKRKLGFSKYLYDGVLVYRFAIPCGPIPHLREFLIKVAALQGFKKLEVEFGKPDIIHAHFTCAGIGAVILKKKYGIPFVLTEHSSGILSDTISKLSQSTAKLAYDQADYLIAVGNGLKSKMVNYTNKPISVLPNILPDIFFSKQANKFERYTFLSVGNLKPSKRFDLTICAFEKIAEVHNNISLILVGQGPEEKALRELVISKGLKDKVEFMGQIPNCEVSELFRRCHCFVLPSEFETFGVVYAEAIASGIPAIGTKCGGPEDIINQFNGLLVEKNDVEALHQAMMHVLENQQNYDSDSISKDAYNRFSEAVIGEKIIKVYDVVNSAN